MVSGEKSLVPCGTLGLLIFVDFGIAEMQYEKKYGPASHRYNPLPLLCSHPGGVHGELVVRTRAAKLVFVRSLNKRKSAFGEKI